MRTIREGLYQWQAPHPDWKPDEGWDQTVSSYALDDGQRLTLFDPLALPGELEEIAAGRTVSVVLTCPWHRRDAESIAARLGARLHVPPPEGPDPNPVEGEVYRAGDRLPGGIEVFLGMEDNDLVLWLADGGLLIAGDTLIDRGKGLEVPSEWIEHSTREQILERLRPLLELPVQLVLPTHGDPVDGAAVRLALT